MRLLGAHIEAITLEVKMIDIGQPDPARPAHRRHPLGTVPLGQLPLVIGSFNRGRGQRCIKVGIDGGIAVAGEVRGAGAKGEVVELGGAVGTSTPHDWIRILVRI